MLAPAGPSACSSFTDAPGDAGATDAPEPDATSDGAVVDGPARGDAGACPAPPPFKDGFERANPQGPWTSLVQNGDGTLAIEKTAPLAELSSLKVAYVTGAAGTVSNAFLERLFTQACPTELSFRIRPTMANGFPESRVTYLALRGSGAELRLVGGPGGALTVRVSDGTGETTVVTSKASLIAGTVSKITLSVAASGGTLDVTPAGGSVVETTFALPTLPPWEGVRFGGSAEEGKAPFDYLLDDFTMN